PHKNSACAAVSEGRKRAVGIFRFNLFLNNSLVIVSGSLCELSEIFTGLIFPQHTEERSPRRHYLASNRLVIGCNEFRPADFATQQRTAAPSVVIRHPATIC